MERWFVAAKRADFQAIAQKFGISPVTARLIRNRDVVGEEAIREYLYGTPAGLPGPWQLKDMRPAADILRRKIREGKRIRIVGDYDIDGVCATYILLTGLRRLGARADYRIPDRVKDGYGINASIIRQAWEDGIDTIVTCDNGIAAIPEIDGAKELGMTVIVTDHHDIPYEELPDGGRREKRSRADAVVNPKQADCPYPFQLLCGAAVAFKLAEALYEEAGLGREEALEDFLEFAAIATVGDIMELRGENRILVKHGLAKLGRTKNTGLRCLMEACGLDPSHISAYHVGFVLGPCINASGRLDTAARALRLLLCQDEEEGRREAQELKRLNDERKGMTEEGVRAAQTLIEAEGLDRDDVLVVPLYGCHESLAGIIAGRIREMYHRPTFVLTDSEEGVKGSGRSIEAYSMYEELARCRELLTKFGGHPMAAGLSLPKENVEAFRQMLNRNSRLQPEDFVPRVSIDAAMPLEYVSERQIAELSLLEPFGKGNEKPQFAQKGLRVVRARIVGKNRNVMRLLLESPASGLRMEGVYFGDVQEMDAYIRGKFGDEEAERMYLGRPNRVELAVVYWPDIHEYQGKRSLQIVVKNYQ